MATLLEAETNAKRQAAGVDLEGRDQHAPLLETALEDRRTQHQAAAAERQGTEEGVDADERRSIFDAVAALVDARLRASSPLDSLTEAIEKYNEEHRAEEPDPTPPGQAAQDTPDIIITANTSAAKMAAPLAARPRTAILCVSLAVIAVAVYVDWHGAIGKLLRAAWSGFLSSYWMQVAWGSCGLSAMVWLGMLVRPGDVDLLSFSALSGGIAKTKLLMMSAVLPVGLYYADFVTDIISLRAFWQEGYYEFFSLNLVGILFAAGYYTVLLNSVGGFSRGGCGCAVLIPMLGFFQLLPALCLLFVLGAFIANKSADDMAHSLRQSGVHAFISCSGLSESLLEALFGAVVQAYSLLHHDMSSSQQTALQVSVMLSILSLTKGFAEIDDKDKIMRYVDGIPFIKGSAAKSDPAFVAVVCYRMVSVMSRLLFVPFFQVLTHDMISFQLRVGGDVWNPACGAFLLLAWDLGLQSALIRHYTGSRRKMGWALANVISPVEPILHGGDRPIFTTKPLAVSTVHLLEAVLAGALIVGHHGSLQTVFGAMESDFDSALLKMCGACCLLQFPLLLAVQRVFSYHVSPRDSMGVAAPLHFRVAMDRADLAAPPSMIALASWDEISGKFEETTLRTSSRDAGGGIGSKIALPDPPPGVSPALALGRSFHTSDDGARPMGQGDDERWSRLLGGFHPILQFALQDLGLIPNHVREDAHEARRRNFGHPLGF
jgi:hypothetical protein